MQYVEDRCVAFLDETYLRIYSHNVGEVGLAILPWIGSINTGGMFTDRRNAVFYDTFSHVCKTADMLAH